MSEEYWCLKESVGGQEYPMTIWRGTRPLIAVDAIDDVEPFIDISDDELEFLLRVLNAHDELVAACKAVRAIVEILPNTLGDVSPLIDAALAKAEGKP